MGPLDGVRVLESGLLVQGPQASLTMHEWGAEVVKVDSRGSATRAAGYPSAGAIAVQRRSMPSTGGSGA